MAKKQNKKIKIGMVLLVLSIIGLLVVGGVVGSQMFPKTKFIGGGDCDGDGLGDGYCEDRSSAIRFEEVRTGDSFGYSSWASPPDSCYKKDSTYACYIKSVEFKFIPGENDKVVHTTNCVCYKKA